MTRCFAFSLTQRFSFAFFVCDISLRRQGILHLYLSTHASVNLLFKMGLRNKWLRMFPNFTMRAFLQKVWLKYDDERVWLVTEQQAIDENFGGSVCLVTLSFIPSVFLEGFAFACTFSSAFSDSIL